MARWTCEQASSIFNRLNNSSNPKEKQAAEAVAKKLGLNPDKEFTEWKQRMSKLFCHFDNDSKIIEEFEGYSKLMEIPIDDYNEHGLPKMFAIFFFCSKISQILNFEQTKAKERC